ncbi:MAG TPA: DUF1214 domain-containing protein [Hyphomicrobium sp.]|nr:DUF1214 domain-containing protein [Hyphomicrobium sp.]
MASLDLQDGKGPSLEQPHGDDRWRRAAREIAALITRMIGTAIAVALVITTGLWSSRTMIARGYEVSTDTYGPWRHWRLEGRADADPYTRAHLSGSGMLRISSDSAGIFEANADSDGARLHSSCNYVIEGNDMGWLWWSLTVYNTSGELIANDADRYTFTSDTAALNPDGSFIVTLGRDARPGNWLPTGGAGRLILNFTILDPSTGLSNDARAERNGMLPSVRREGCS